MIIKIQKKNIFRCSTKTIRTVHEKLNGNLGEIEHCCCVDEISTCSKTVSSSLMIDSNSATSDDAADTHQKKLAKSTVFRTENSTKKHFSFFFLNEYFNSIIL